MSNGPRCAPGNFDKAMNGWPRSELQVARTAVLLMPISIRSCGGFSKSTWDWPRLIQCAPSYVGERKNIWQHLQLLAGLILFILQDETAYWMQILTHRWLFSFFFFLDECFVNSALVERNKRSPMAMSLGAHWSVSSRTQKDSGSITTVELLSKAYNERISRLLNSYSPRCKRVFARAT